jgi:SAM-dependent methyltransferase
LATNRPEEQLAARSEFGTPEAAEQWRRAAGRRASTYGRITELMLDLAGLQAGSRVLDVAAGTGDTTLLAARRVGPSGYLLAIDISASMLALAAEAAREAGLASVETRVMDGQELDIEPESFDAVISRNGLMFVPDIRKALASVRRVLKPAGRLAAIVFSTPEKNPYSALPQAIVRRHRGEPPLEAGQPGQFALGGPGVMENLLREAGFLEVSVQPFATNRAFSSLAVMMDTLKETSIQTRDAVKDLPNPDRAWIEIEQAFQPFVGSDGSVSVPGESLVAVGRK